MICYTNGGAVKQTKNSPTAYGQASLLDGPYIAQSANDFIMVKQECVVGV